MKSKISKIMGIGLAFVLLVSMMVFALPASAGPYAPLAPALPNQWAGSVPTAGVAGGWFYDPDITQVGPIAEAINGDLYAYVAGTAATPANPLAFDIFKSDNDGRTWTVSAVPFYYGGGAVVDMVCSSMSEDVIYLTDGNYVYRSINGGVTFTLVAAEDLEAKLMGVCGIDIIDEPITSIDVGYDGAGQPMVFIGTRDVGTTYDPGTGPLSIVGSVYWIADQTFSAMWTDLQVRCYGCCDYPAQEPTGCFDVYAVAAAPGFANVSKVYAVVTAPLTAINFPIISTAQVEVRAGDYGAVIETLDTDGLITDGDVVFSGGGIGVFPYTMTANEVVTFTGQGAAIDVAEAVDIQVTDGTISWRLDTTVGTADATFCGGTFAVSTLGTVCSWSTVTELRWNCLWSFTIEHASRIMFPSYYGTNPTLFVGVAAGDNVDPAPQNGPGEGGDVYRVADTIPPSGAIDLNVQGFTTGCTGLAHANICSLDIQNDALVAGAWDSYQSQSPTRVYYSADGGWTWSPSLKDPTGTLRAWVLFGGSIVAGTSGCDCAFSLDCGANPGQFFNQISLIDMDIDGVLDLTHAPGYLDGSTTMFVLTTELVACDDDPLNSLLRWDGTYWERVHSSRFFAALTQVWVGAPLYDWVEVSPDFNTTSTLYMANTSFYMARSIDKGCSWAPLTYPCYDRPTISAWIVVDQETVLAAGADTFAGNIYRTLNHGAQPWSAFAALNACSGVDFDLSLPRSADSDVLFGDLCGQVFLSSDLGATWAEIANAVTGSFNYAVDGMNTYVVFDPGYGIEGDPGVNMVYAAAGTKVGRCDINSAALMFQQDWVYISTASAACDPFALQEATGIDAAGDTALYVSDAGSAAGDPGEYEASGTIAVSYNAGANSCDLTIAVTSPADFVWINGTFVAGEPLSIIQYDLYCDEIALGVETYVKGEILVQGLINGGFAKILISEQLEPCVSCTPDNSAITVISSYLTIETVPSVVAGYLTGVWRTLNPMDLTPPAFPAFVEWEFLSLSTTSQLIHPEAASLGVFPDDLWLTAGSNMLWALDSATANLKTIWMWDDVLAAPVILISPADGALLATSLTATIEWEPLDAATSYQVYIYSFCATCPDNMVLDFNFETPLTCYVLEGLTPGTTYYWKVRVACNEPYVSKWSTLSSFDTALSSVPYLCSPFCGQDDVILTTNFSWDPVLGATSYEVQVVAASADGTADWTGATTLTADTNAIASIPGLEYSTVYYWQVRAASDGVFSAWAVCIFTTVDEPAEPVEPITPVTIVTEEVTPLWIWVIIGIGAALVICVIVLIVNTRRVP